MIRLQLKYRSDDDDYAPIDYSFVASQAEGQRRKEGAAIHRDPIDAVVRHRVNPGDGTVDEYGTHARRSPIGQNPQQERVRRGIPSLADGPAPARSIAYPQGMEPQAGPQRTHADVAQEAMQPPVVPGAAGHLERLLASQELTGQAGEPPMESASPAAQPEFDPPAPPEIPEWLRVARQNNMPMSDRPSRPQVVSASRQQEGQTDLLGRPVRGRPTVDPNDTTLVYEDAGYPPELLEQHYQMEQERRAQELSGQRRGAQHAVQHQHPPQEVPRRRRAEAPLSSSYPPSREEWYGEQPRRRAPSQQEWEAVQQRQDTYAAGGYADQYAPQGYAPYENAAPNAPPGLAPYAQQGYAQPGPYVRRRPPSQVEAGYEDSYEVTRDPRTPSLGRRIPWLGIGAGVAAFVAVLLWLLQMSFTTQLTNLQKEREEANAALVNSNPYRYRELIETQAQLNNLHPAFVAAIVLNESSFNPQAESSVGARGLMQMMPDTAQWVHGKIGEGAPYSFDLMYDANVNVRYACWYMNFLSERFRGDPVLVAAAFHAGQGTVQNWLSDSKYSQDSQTIDLENMMDGPTKSYCTKIMKSYAAYKKLYYENMEAL